ncbi:MAG: type II secretion system minor pseudopilin GspI [Agarilytica sp.]
MIKKKLSKSRGFTLIEVLIALVIVGMALPAMLLRMQAILDDTDHITKKTYAYWLAENKRQEMAIRQKLERNVVKKRKQQDTEEFLGHDWHWKIEIQETDVPKMYRMEISVGLDEDSPLANLSGFLNE